MKILLYNRLNTEPVQRQFDKTLNYLQQGDFRSADVRKMKTQGFYRARLDDTNRLLFKIGEYKEEKYLFILEVILNHDYDKSCFLRGAAVQEERLKPIFEVDKVDKDDVVELSYLNPSNRQFTILDKFITFDEKQSNILEHEPPMLLLGAAGSGKTVLALEKIRQTPGRILYVTLSSALAQKAQEIYHKENEPIPEQEVKFSSLDQFLRLFLTPKGEREALFLDFKLWFERIRATVRIKDAHKLFEEIRGVLTGTFTERDYFSPDEYQQLGVRQSVFPATERMDVYAIFTRYLAWLNATEFYDPNIFARFAYQHIKPTFDLVVVDEVQDMTTMQLSAVLKSLHRPDQFLLCGDANQVVHPNFFSWTSVKRLLHERNLNREILRLLPGNHRNDENIVKMTNRVLALKNVRFGSIDRESNFVIETNDLPEGDEHAVQFFEATQDVLNYIDKAASASSDIAVIVLRDEDKAAARQRFQTPLVFSVHEAKGLEYPYVILYNFISDSKEQFASICEGVAPRDLKGSLQYNRPKDKEDRSLQAYQFYINSLYVAMTRAIGFLYVVEREPKHRLYDLLGVRILKKRIQNRTSMPVGSLEDWQREAERLEKFGNKEQADAIKAKYGNTAPTPWSVTTYQEYIEIRAKYIKQLSDIKNIPSFSVREKAKMYNFLTFYPDLLGITTLTGQSKNYAKQLMFDTLGTCKKLIMPYLADNFQRIAPIIKKYGPNHYNEVGLTPLMLAAMAGATNIAKQLLMAGADPNATDNWGRCAYQLAIVRAYKNEQFAKEKFKEIADIVHPPYLKLRSDEDKLAVPYGNLSFLITAIILALQQEFYLLKCNEAHVGFQAEDFCKILQHLVTDEKTAKEYRKENVTAFLAKSDVKLNKSPFIIRLRKDYYTIMLNFEIKVCDEWIMLQDLFDIFNLVLLQGLPAMKAFQDDILAFALELRQHYEGKIEKQLMDEDEAFAAKLPDEDLRDWPV